MPAYTLYVTIDWRGDCVKGHAQYTANGETEKVHRVEDPEFLTPASVCSELLHAVKLHSEVVKENRRAAEFINADDGA